jgi:hypothetical protein
VPERRRKVDQEPRAVVRMQRADQRLNKNQLSGWVFRRRAKGLVTAMGYFLWRYRKRCARPRAENDAG